MTNMTRRFLQHDQDFTKMSEECEVDPDGDHLGLIMKK